MNLYQSLLFQYGYISKAELVDTSYGPTYGNRIATERALREPWQLGRETAESLAEVAC